MGRKLRTLIVVITRICGHAFVLAMLLTYGADFTIQDDDDDDLMMKTPDHQATTNTQNNGMAMYPIKVVNKKNFKGPSEYIGRAMKGIVPSPLGNPFYIAASRSIYPRCISINALPQMAMESNDAGQIRKGLPRTNTTRKIKQRARAQSSLLVRPRTLPRRYNQKRNTAFNKNGRSQLTRLGQTSAQKFTRTPRPIYGFVTAISMAAQY